MGQCAVDARASLKSMATSDAQNEWGCGSIDVLKLSVRTMAKALFLDRDGVINVDTGYVHTKEDFVFVDGIFDLVRTAVTRGYKVIVITNQAGIGRGYYDENQFLALMDWVAAQFAAAGAPLTAVYFCPHHPEKARDRYRQACDCRKPEPGLLNQAAQDHRLDMSGSIMVGDKNSDMEAARLAGVARRVLFQPTGNTAGKMGSATHIVNHLTEVFPLFAAVNKGRGERSR